MKHILFKVYPAIVSLLLGFLLPGDERYYIFFGIVCGVALDIICLADRED